MANWQGAILTDAGRALQAKVEGGLCQLALTKLKTGDGTLAPGQTLEELTDLVSPKQNVSISAIVLDSDQPGLVYVKGILTNVGLVTGYLVKELGLFATDPDDGEILYAVTIDPNPDYLQDQNSATVISEAIKLAIAVSNASDVTATLDPDGLLTVEDMDIHNDDPDAHDGILEKVADLLGDIVTHLASNAAISISSLNTSSVFYRLLSYALTAAGVQYNFTNSNAWYICLGSLFGGLIIQGGEQMFPGNTKYKDFSFPIEFPNMLIQGLLCDNAGGEATSMPNDVSVSIAKDKSSKTGMRALAYRGDVYYFYWLAVGI